MVKSVLDHGVHTPIIIRPITGTEKYETLSGHNRAAEAKEAGFDSVPAIVKKWIAGCGHLQI